MIRSSFTEGGLHCLCCSAGYRQFSPKLGERAERTWKDTLFYFRLKESNCFGPQVWPLPLSQQVCNSFLWHATLWISHAQRAAAPFREALRPPPRPGGRLPPVCLPVGQLPVPAGAADAHGDPLVGYISFWGGLLFRNTWQLCGWATTGNPQEQEKGANGRNRRKGKGQKCQMCWSLCRKTAIRANWKPAVCNSGVLDVLPWWTNVFFALFFFSFK